MGASFRGIVLVPGRAAGRLVVVTDPVPATSRRGEDKGPATPEAEAARFQKAVSLLARSYRLRAEELEKNREGEEAEIVRVHAELAADLGFGNRVRQAIERFGETAEQAVLRVADDLGASFRSSGNPVIAERAADLRDLALQIQRLLGGGRSPLAAAIPAEVQRPVVAVKELYPSLVLEGRDLGVQGFLVEVGTKFSHAAILAASFGIPILRLGRLDDLMPVRGELVLVDGQGEGLVSVNPEGPPVSAGKPREAEVRKREAPNSPLRLWATIATPGEIRGATWDEAVGVGLYRTETLVMDHCPEPPSEIEQYRVYRRLFRACGGRPVTVRCFDIGGDKPVDFMAFGQNHNPQLGLRSLRLFRFHPELFTTQIRALVRAMQGHSGLRLLYPMVETPEEWRFANELTDRALATLRDSEPWPVGSFQRGFMIETPSALWCLDELFAEADFASIGANDLVQFLFGADRTNPDVGSYYRPEHPTVLRALKHVVSKARAAATPLMLCGEMARDPHLLPLLLGLGLRHLSVPIPALAGLAEAAAKVTIAECEDLAGACLAAADRRAVREILAEWHGEKRESSPVSSALDTDPVCGMNIDPAATPYAIVDGGRMVYFCSAACRTRYSQGMPRESARDPGAE